MTAVLWTAKQCAEALGVGYKAFCDRICVAPGFPKPIDQAHVTRLWKSAEVTAWAKGETLAA
jgi:predicted DNA-binding transcriptional regulator AlpA